MKRFQWRLQTLLDVTAGREQACRLEVFGLTAQATGVRREILARQETVHGLLTALGAQRLAERLPRHQLFLACAETARREIAGLEERLKELQRQRDEKMAQYMQQRSKRKALDRLREEAQKKHMKEWEALEQKATDEGAGIAFARGMMSRRA
jgi:flagellar biosynthesis chaperone FliJ